MACPSNALPSYLDTNRIEFRLNVVLLLCYWCAEGQTLGHQDHVSPGAVRTLRCDPGFMLNGSAAQHQDGDSLVICNADGSWSNNRRARCIREPATGAPSTPPTRSPVDYEEVNQPF